MKIIFIYLAPAFMCLGLLLVYQLWKVKSWQLSILWLGWPIVVLSALVFVLAHGYEYGVVLAFSCLSISSWLIIIFNIKYINLGIDVKQSSKKYNIKNKHSRVNALSIMSIFFIGGPLSIIVSALFSMASALLLPLERANQMAVAALSFPVLFGFIFYFVCMHQNTSRDVLVLTLIAIISAGWIYL